MASPQSVAELAAGVRAGDRGVLARALTLVESQRADHRRQAQELLAELLPETGRAQRIGVTGVPGVGKSTFLEAFGMHLVEAGQRVAVLAVDPSSSVTGGSILGDKARMHQLAQRPEAFIRPSPSGATLGGVARRTRECLLLCEAADFDTVLVETVGVGQSETLVADMVDFFLVLALPGAGDELQGIKKGILELADLIAVNKSDGENQARARVAVRDMTAALRYLRPRFAAWTPRVLAISAREGTGLEEVAAAIAEHRQLAQESGHLASQRASQQARWLWEEINDELRAAFRAHPGVGEQLAAIESAVRAGELPPGEGAQRLLAAFAERATDAREEA
ncbi:MAG: methylmalonyl Co-A mutase-associated GTPase MeaB [Planctomycetes bacterium]|nr:methylmalonyl Co-A mutase-associated GTPase MeaB [Planctomycetota bacterium]